MKPRHDGGETSKQLFLIQLYCTQKAACCYDSAPSITNGVHHNENFVQKECPTFDHLASIPSRVDTVMKIYDDLLTQWRHIPMDQFSDNIFWYQLLPTTYFWASEVFIFIFPFTWLLNNEILVIFQCKNQFLYLNTWFKHIFGDFFSENW